MATTLSTHRRGSPFRFDPSLYAIVILLCAGILIVYLQHNGLQTLQHQTTIIQQQVSQRAADAVASGIRRTFDGPAVDTLTFLHHPLLEAGRLDLVAHQFEAGLEKYPQLDRFFLWHSVTESLAPGEVIFFSGDRPESRTTDWSKSVSSNDSRFGGFKRDPALGKSIYEATIRNSKTQRVYSVTQVRVGDEIYDSFALLLWTGPDRHHLYAVSGYVVNRERVRNKAIAEMYQRSLASILEQAEEAPPLELSVLDEFGKTVFGSAEPPDSTSGRATFDLAFYPTDQLRQRVAGKIPLVRWEVIVSPGAHFGQATWLSKGYALLGVALMLVLLALILAIQGRSRSARLAQMQIDFVSHVSHQLKTPLSLLSAAAETLDTDRVSSPTKFTHYVGIIRNEIQHLSTLVGRSLEFSRSQTRRNALEFERVDLEEFLRETIEAFRSAVGAGPEDVQIRFEADSRPIVVADPTALEQVVVNLLDNAVKYSLPPRRIAVRVSQAGRDAIVDVHDQGIGIAKLERARIFEKFYRGADANSHSSGFGLGLAIVHELVTAHKGWIDVESEIGRGTTFRIRLPIAREKWGIAARALQYWHESSYSLVFRRTARAQEKLK